MMFNTNYYLTLLILIWMQKSVNSISFKEIYDINGIKKFIQQITYKKPVEYQLGKVLSDGEKSKIIVDDLVGLLDNLNSLIDRNHSASRDLLVFLKTFNEKLSDHGQTSFNYMDPLNDFDNTSGKINSYADMLMKLRNDFGYDLAKYCPTVSNITRNISLEKKGVIIEKNNKVLDLKRYIYDYPLNDPCGKKVLSKQLFDNFYQEIITLFLKEYVIRYYLDIINAQCPNRNLPSTKMDEFILISRLQRQIEAMKLQSKKSHSLHRCDPPNYDNSKGQTYYELSKMIQGVIVKEEDLDINQSCSHNCNTDDIINSMNLTVCQKYQECRYVDSNFEICEIPDSDQSTRKYQWFKDSHGLVYGDNSTECKMPIKTVSSTLSVTKFRWCDYCLCTCVKEKLSSNNDVLFVSFREQLTDIDKNMVVVGVRFVKKANMIHVQIKEAELKPHRLTGKSKWKELENLNYNEPTNSFYVKNDDGTQTPLKEGIDYVRPDEMNLESMFAPSGFVITGIAFRFFEDPSSQKSHTGSLELRIRVTPFDYFEGRLINDNQTKWLPVVSNQWAFLSELNLNDADLPTKSPKNDDFWINYHYVKFRASDMIKDAGQSTVPFFDAQDVEGEPEFPLGGVGVGYRGQRGYGGFLAFQIYMTDISEIYKDKLYDAYPSFNNVS